ncbi:MAG: hypothetical protein ABIK92_10565 [Pseudomonadota bacterium]
MIILSENITRKGDVFEDIIIFVMPERKDTNTINSMQLISVPFNIPKIAPNILSTHPRKTIFRIYFIMTPRMLIIKKTKIKTRRKLNTFI